MIFCPRHDACSFLFENGFLVVLAVDTVQMSMIAPL